MEILKTILELVFIVLPFIGGGGFFLWKALQLEKARTDEYRQTMVDIRYFVRYLKQKEDGK